MADLDRRQLTFLTDNRPARLYLYFRYALAIIQALMEKNPVVDDLPSGTIWATPGKKDGYLRRSTLRALARQIGGKDLPEELMEAGTFEDPDTASPVQDQVTAIEMGRLIREEISGKGKERKEESEEEEESDEEEEEESGEQKGEGVE
ncbi:MAG: hypothetical protein M1812_002481 [Candelaria pacifica]|nr:MAG: hypothetical protein M1812_002481 [Candelaria pacifica]